MSRDKCCDFATLLKMNHQVLPVISQIFYVWYLQELKSRYSGITLLMINMLGICKINCTGIFATSTTCEKTTRIKLELSHISYTR